jgi:hypothetical protein
MASRSFFSELKRRNVLSGERTRPRVQAMTPSSLSTFPGLPAFRRESSFRRGACAPRKLTALYLSSILLWKSKQLR